MKHLAFLLSKSKVSHGRFLLKHGKQERFPSYSAIFRRNAARAAFPEDLRPSGHGTPRSLPGEL